MSSSFTDPNDSQAESENNFLASYMMEVEDDNVDIGRMTTDVSGNSGLDGQSEKKFYGFASMDELLLTYYELQIRVLTSDRSDIEKINRKKCKIHSDQNRYVPKCYYINCQVIFLSNARYLQNFLSNIRQILDISHIHLNFKGVLQYTV